MASVTRAKYFLRTEKKNIHTYKQQEHFYTNSMKMEFKYDFINNALLLHNYTI